MTNGFWPTRGLRVFDPRMTEETFDMSGEPEGMPEEPESTDNAPRPEDGEQDVSQDPDVDYSDESVVPPAGEE